MLCTLTAAGPLCCWASLAALCLVLKAWRVVQAAAPWAQSPGQILAPSACLQVKVEPGSWYKTIKKPLWTPPNWAFPGGCMLGERMSVWPRGAHRYSTYETVPIKYG
jgi:tryptophan-rich sensory protein